MRLRSVCRCCSARLVVGTRETATSLEAVASPRGAGAGSATGGAHALSSPVTLAVRVPSSVRATQRRVLPRRKP